MSPTNIPQQPPPPDPGDIARHPVLAELPLAEQRAVLSRADAIHVANHEILFHEDQPARHIFLCRQGQLRLYRLAPNGSEKIIGLVNPGQSFAEAAAFMQDATYPVSCSALRDSELVRFDAEHLVGMLRDSPESCIRLLGLVCARLRSRVVDIESLALQNVQLRVVNYLLRLREQHGPTVELPSSKKHIAGLLGAQPETLSRVLTTLRELGIIHMDRRQVTILDQTRLTAIAEGREPSSDFLSVT